MTYGGVLKSEQEVVFRLDAEDQTVHVTSTWPAWSRKLERRYGAPGDVSYDGASAHTAVARVLRARREVVTVAWWTLPLKAISLRRPPKPGAYTRQRGGFPRRTSKQSTV